MDGHDLVARKRCCWYPLLMTATDRTFDAIRRLEIDRDPSANAAVLHDRTQRRVRALSTMRSGERLADWSEAQVEGLRNVYVKAELHAMHAALRLQQRRLTERAREKARAENPDNGTIAAMIAANTVAMQNPHIFAVADEEMREKAVQRVARERPWLHPRMTPDIATAAGTKEAKRVTARASLTPAQRQNFEERAAHIRLMAEGLKKSPASATDRIANAFAAADAPLNDDDAATLARALDGQPIRTWHAALRAGVCHVGDTTAYGKRARFDAALAAVEKRKLRALAR